MDWKFIMCLLVMCSTTIWKLLKILAYGEIQVQQVDDVMTLYMAFTIYAAYKAGMAVQAKRQKQTEEKIATTSDKQKGE
jgi:Ca2+/Na+ antiporter